MSENLDRALAEAAKKKLINDQVPSIDLIDMDYLTRRAKDIMEGFPEPYFLHAAALKANSLRGILKHVRKMGLGGECASISEAEHAISLGFPPNTVVYDSPCKTKHDMKRALDLNIYINLDNEYEIEQVNELLQGSCANSKSKIGLRINPCVGAGSIAIISTATKLSKFGVPMTDSTKDRILDLYAKHKWLTGIHVHVGSQGVPLDLFVQGVEVCLNTVKAIEKHCGRNLDTIDIGGGLSTSYTEPSEPKGFEYTTYRKALEAKVPDLFSGKYKVITEFGRSLFLKSGVSVTRVEHVKQWIPEVKPIVLTHVGTNQFIRETYLPDVWRHRFSLADPDGNVKTGETKLYDLAGPMCFQGDYLAKDVPLPHVKNGDWLIIHDTGAYTMAMYSKFNSILPSAVYGFSQSPDDGSLQFVCLKERETSEETLVFWGSENPRVV